MTGRIRPAAAADPGGVLGRRSGSDRAMVPRGPRVLASGWLAADDARSAGGIGAGPSARRLDVLVDGRPQRVLPARDVPVRAAAGAADATRCQAVRHRLRPDRRVGGRLRPDADATGDAWARRRSATRSDPPARVARACATPTACTSRSWRTTRSQASGLARAAPALPGRRALGHAVGPRSRPVGSVLLPRARPAALRRRAASARARGALGSGRRADVAAACSTPAASSSSSCSISIRSGGRARRATGSGIKASSTSRSVLAAGAITASSTVARAPPERGRTAGRFTCRAPASSTSTTRTSSRSSCCGCPRPRTSAGASRRDQRRAAAAGGHARGQADDTDRRARAGHVGRDRRPRDTCPNGSASAPSAAPSTAHRIPTAAVRAAAEASRREHHRTGAGLRAAERHTATA